VSDLVLHAWVISDGGEGYAFLADIWRMLLLVAKRDGCRVEDVHETKSAASRVGRVRGMTLSLFAEFGVHRAQRLPGDSTTGRIVTTLVEASLPPRIRS
jgi:protein subunit release factor A